LLGNRMSSEYVKNYFAAVRHDGLGRVPPLWLTPGVLRGRAVVPCPKGEGIWPSCSLRSHGVPRKGRPPNTSAGGRASTRGGATPPPRRWRAPGAPTAVHQPAAGAATGLYQPTAAAGGSEVPAGKHFPASPNHPPRPHSPPCSCVALAVSPVGLWPALFPTCSLCFVDKWGARS